MRSEDHLLNDLGPSSVKIITCYVGSRLAHMRVAWLFGLALEPLSPLTFDASFDDYRIAAETSGDALTLRQIVHLIEGPDVDESDEALLLTDENLSVPDNLVDQSLADFQAAHEDTPFHSVFENFRGAGFPPIQSLEALTNEMLHTHKEPFSECLCSRADRWRRCGLHLPPTVQQILQDGLQLPFTHGPPQPFHFQHAPSLTSNSLHIQFVDSQIMELLGIGAIRDVGCLHDIKASGEFFLSAIVVVGKGPVHDRSSKLRMCLSCRGTNEEPPRLGLQMSTLERRRGELKQGRFFSFIAITKGYFHIPLHNDIRRYVAFTWRGKVYT